MKTVQLYIGRNYIDLDCILVTYVIGGVKWNIELQKDGEAFGRNTYYYTNTLLTIQLAYSGTDWQLSIDTGTTLYYYFSADDSYYPIIKEWSPIFGSEELDFVGTSECVKLKYERIELFEDEKINVTSSIQNLSDISKTFTDFSQSFTIPGSVVNNKIFEHFYQNDIDGTIDHNIKRPAYIEIDFVPFRKGLISLERSQVKNGRIDNYQISFFGLLTNLTNIFGDTQLNQLDYSAYEFAYNGTNIYNRITDSTTDYDVRYPLIASDRLWSYGNLGSEDITQNSHAIKFNELFPAIKIPRIFDAIQSYFDINFTSSFFSDERFEKCFLLAKNAIKFEYFTETKSIDFINKTQSDDANWLSNISGSTYNNVDIVNNKIKVSGFGKSTTVNSINVFIVSKSAVGSVFVNVYKNGIYDQTLTGTAVGTMGSVIVNDISDDAIYEFTMQTNNAMNVEVGFIYNCSIYLGGSSFANSISSITTSLLSFSGNLNVGKYMPNIKVSDFLSGIIKEFNLTCVGINENTFQLMPLEDWYNIGGAIDISKYVDSESIDIARIPLYNTIEFKHQQSEAFTNRNYFKLANQEYGDAKNTYSYDGGNFVVDSPFENLLFARSVDQFGGQAILGYNLNESYNGYVPKPTLLYMYGQSTSLSAHQIKFYNGSTHVNISHYQVFGQDITVSGNKYSLNFGADNSIIHEETIQNGLFATYYFNYLSNLYNLKQRLTTVKTMLPTSIITNLQLNDRLIIRDKRYIINDIKIELTSGEATLSLYNDFREIEFVDIKTIEAEGGTIGRPLVFRPLNSYGSINGDSGITFSGDLNDKGIVTWGVNDYSDKLIYVTIPENTTGDRIIWNYNFKYQDKTELNYIVIQNKYP